MADCAGDREMVRARVIGWERPIGCGEIAQAPDKSGFHSACGSLSNRARMGLEGVVMDCHWRKKATRQCESALAGHMFFGGCSSCNHVRCTKTATSYNYQFPLDHLLLNRAYLSGRAFDKSRSDPGPITDRRRRYDAVQITLPRGEELGARRPRPSFETRPARGTPHIIIVTNGNDPRQAPNAFCDMKTRSQESRPHMSVSQPQLIRSGNLRSAKLCWTFLIFDGLGTRRPAARVVFEGKSPYDPSSSLA